MIKHMKTTTLCLIAIFLAVVISKPLDANAYPALQLDVANGLYDEASETIVSSSDQFTLYAYLLPGVNRAPVSGTYHISAALVATNSGAMGPGLGSFSFNGVQTNVTSGMVFGVPPLEANLSFDNGDLSKHEIFPTYFKEFTFRFDANDMTARYNTQDRARAGTPINIAANPTGANMYYAAFTVDTSLLAPGYAIHFDLYNEMVKCGDTDVNKFAPFSHDAQSRTQVPEPATITLIGAGLVGLWFFGKNRKNAAKQA